jgi:branched-chain amino acid transport system permease protein
MVRASTEVGAGVLHALRDQIMPLTDYWRLLLGLSIIAMVLIFPRGLVGTVRHWREARA